MDYAKLAVDFLQNIRPLLGRISLCSESDAYTFLGQEAVRGSTKLEGAYRISFLHCLTNVDLNRTAGNLGHSYGESNCTDFWIACIDEDDGSGIDVAEVALGVCTTRWIVAHGECVGNWHSTRAFLDVSLCYHTIDWNVPAMVVGTIEIALEDGASNALLRRRIVVQQMLQAVRLRFDPAVRRQRVNLSLLRARFN